MHLSLSTAILVLIALLLSGCGVASSVAPVVAATAAEVPAADPAEERTLEELAFEVPVTRECASLPDLPPAERRQILAQAKKANPDARIRGLYLMNVFHSDELQVRVTYEPYETSERVRRYHSVFLLAKARPSSERTREQTNDWALRSRKQPLEVNLEICPDWRSFTSGLPPLDSETLHLWFEPEQSLDTTLAIVDQVRDLIPEGDRIWNVESDEDLWGLTDEEKAALREREVDVYKVRTVRGCGGAILTVQNADGRWTAENVGVWIS